MSELVATASEKFTEPVGDDGPSRGRDEELLAIGRIVRILDGMEERARRRAATWLFSRYMDK